MNAPETLTLNVQVPADVLAAALIAAATAAEAQRTRWLRIREAAKHCGLGVTAFGELVAKFNPPKATIGRAVAFATTNLDAMMAANQTPGGSAVKWPVTAGNIVNMENAA